MFNSEWIIENGRIMLLHKSRKNYFFPSAMQIYSAAFSNLKEIESFIPDKNIFESFEKIVFSRIPAEPIIKIKNFDSSSASVFIGVNTDIGFSEIEENQDQIIKNNKWYPINLSLIDEAKEWLIKIDIIEKTPITLGQLVLLKKAQGSPITISDESTFLASEIASNAGKNFTDIFNLNAELYPYQREGIAFLQLIAHQDIGCILADEMGLGKTLQIIALLQSEKNFNRPLSLVIAPATVVENWRREIIQFAPQLNVYIHSGANRFGLAEKIKHFDAVITSFDTAIRDELLLTSIDWNLLILDEAQAIKNPNAQRTQVIKRFPRRVSIAVTGTPMENRINDLWSLADFAMPGLLGPLDEFIKKFTDSFEDAGRIEPLVSPILLRRKVADVARDLPEKLEIPQPIDMGFALAEKYEILRHETINEYGPAAGIVATTKLRMYCTHPYLIDDQITPIEIPKYSRLIEILSEIFESGEKVLIFTTYQRMVDLLMQDMPQKFPTGTFDYIDGRVQVQSRQITIDEFYSFDGFGALFLNPKAAGAGLNITAANHVIHYNPEWNPALTDQASRRAYRRKQNKPVTIHYLYYVNSIEEVIFNRAQLKRELANEAVVGHEGNIDASLIAQALQISPFINY